METGARVWLIAPDWQVRALVHAQLREEGHEVTSVESWDGLVAQPEDGVPAPHLVIAQLTGDEPPAVLRLLGSLPGRRLVLREAGAPGADLLRSAGAESVLSRPYTVAEVVRAARSLLGSVIGKRTRPGRRSR
jgi:CheY-like chemotaxis protein